MTLQTDVPAELHIHGYELSKDVDAGKTGSIKFTADTTGEFEVEAHQLVHGEEGEGVELATAAGQSVTLPLAHALLIGRQDLPIPQWLFAWGAAVVLVVSFIALSLLWRRARFEDDSWRPTSARTSRILVNPVTEVLAGALGVCLLGVVIWSGLEGSQVADTNFSLTFVFITFWLGWCSLSVLFGDVFRAVNPWRAIGRAYGGLVRRLTG